MKLLRNKFSSCVLINNSFELSVVGPGHLDNNIRHLLIKQKTTQARGTRRVNSWLAFIQAVWTMTWVLSEEPHRNARSSLLALALSLLHTHIYSLSVFNISSLSWEIQLEIKYQKQFAIRQFFYFLLKIIARWEQRFSNQKYAYH